MFPLAYLSLWLLDILNTDTSILLAGFLRGEYVNLPIFLIPLHFQERVLRSSPGQDKCAVLKTLVITFILTEPLSFSNKMNTGQ